MKNILIKFCILLLLTTCKVQGQEVKIEYDRTDIDTADFIYQTVKLRVNKFPKNTNTCELINAYGIDESNKKIKPEYFLTQANREFWITFKKEKKSKKLTGINGKVRFFDISEDSETLINVDSILEKVNKTIYLKNDTKIVVLNMKSLKSKKEKNPLDYKNEIISIVKANKLNQKWFEDTLKKSFETYYDLFDMMIYCEDTKNNIDDINGLFTKFSKYPEGIKNNFIKTFLFSKDDASNIATISIKNPETFQEIDFKEVISQKD